MKRLLLWGLGLASLAISAQSPSLPSHGNLRKLSKIQDVRDGVYRRDLDDPQRRIEQEFDMIKDPSSGKIPDNIHEKELAFVNSSRAKLTKGHSILGGNQGGFDWVKRGPYNVGGRTRALAIDVTDENIILAGGVSGGVWRSTDGGSSWTKTNGSSDLHSVTSLAQDTRSGQESTWYYVTGELIGNSASEGGASYAGNGVYKSTDGGLNWTLLTSTSSSITEFDSYFDYNWRVAVNPTNGDVMVAGYGRIWRSNNGGTSFTAVLSDNNAQTTDIVISSTGVMYASFDDYAGNAIQGIHRSTDGVNWTNITPNSFPSSFGRTVLAIAPTDDNVVYALTYAPSHGNTGHGFYKYDNGSWSDRSNNLPAYGDPVGDFNSQQEYNMMVAVHPTNENTVFVGGTNLYRSTNGFSSQNSTTWIGGYSPSNNVSQYTNQHPDVHTLIFYPSSPNQALCGTDGGVHRANDITENGGGTTPVDWTDLNNGYQTTQVHAMAFDYQANVDIILAGFQDNGTWGSTGSTETDNWTEEFSGDGAYCAIVGNGLVRYVSSQNGNIYKFVYRANGSEDYWTRITPSLNSPSFISPFIIDPDNEDVMYMPDGNDIMRNNGLGSMDTYNQSETSQNWTRLSNTGTSRSITALEVANGHLYYGTNNGEVFRMNNASSGTPSPTNISSNNFPGANVQCIQIDPTNANSIFVVFSNYGVRSIYHSSDAGSSWTDISGNLEENADGSGNGPSVRWLDVVNSGNLKTYLVGTSTGVYSTETLDGTSTSWRQEGLATIGQVVTSMIQSNVNGEMIVGTHGNGLFSSNIASSGNASPSANFSANDQSIAIGGSVDFTDESLYDPTSWSWTFTGAQTTSSTDQNPTGIVYNTPGCYEVSLTATNTNGSDTETKVCYVTVTSDNAGTEACDCEANTNVAQDENLTAYNFGANGYLTGRNTYGIIHFAEAMTNTGIKQLKKVRFGANIIHQADANAFFTVNIYDVSNGRPNSVLHSQEVAFSDVDPNNLTDVEMSETVLVDGDFFVDFQIRENASDTILFLTTQDRTDANENKLYVDYSGGWYTYTELQVDISLSLGVAATLCDNYYTETVDACQNQSFTYADGTVINSVSGSDSHISSLITPLGCDSIVNQTLNVIQGASSAVTETVCYGESFTTPEGTTMSSQAGVTTVVETLDAANGCDSLVTYTLNELSLIEESVAITVCVGEDYTTPEGTLIQTTNGTGSFTETLSAASGCDSLVHYTVTENEPSSILSRNVCEGSDFTLINGTTIQNVITDQSYDFTFTSVDGCDSVVTEVLNVVELDNGISRSGTLLVSAMYSVDFQWLDCDNNRAEIAGATSRIYTPTENGNYAVRVGQHGCETFSECIYFDGFTSVNDLNNVAISVYPNPATDKLFVEFKSNENYQASIFDMNGKLVQQLTLSQDSQFIEIANYAAGDYVLKLTDGVAEKSISFTKQ